MTNLFTHPRYAERVLRLAVGVEPLDAVAGGRTSAPLRVLVEDAPIPLDRWRRWRPGETLDDALGGLDRHPSGRFARVYGPDTRLGFVVLRLVQRQGRRIVPRRIGITVTAETAAVPPFSRMYPVGLFPGADAALPSRSTVVHGYVRTGAGDPVRWVRVRAVDAADDEVGWAHGDDRGEFVLAVTASPSGVVLADDPLPVRLTVMANRPPPTPDPTDPLRAVLDPVWDLPVEPLPPLAVPDDRYAGRAALPGQTGFGPFPFDLPLGRETSVQIQIP